MTGLDRTILCMNAAHADGYVGGKDGNPVAGSDGAGEYGPGNDRSVPGKGKHAIDGETKQSRVASERPGSVECCRRSLQVRLQLSRPNIRLRGRIDPKQRRLPKYGGGKQSPNFRLRTLEPRRIHAVHLREHNRASLDPQQLQNGSVLPGLWHDSIVRSNDEQGEVDATRSRGHRVHETLVSGNI